MSETIGNIIAKDVSARDQSENGARRGNMFTRKSGKIMLKNENGMTLIEILVVIGIIGILAGIGTGMLMRELPNVRMKEATRNLYYDIQSAKMNAVRGRGTCTLNVISGTSYELIVPGTATKTVNLADFGVRFESFDATPAVVAGNILTFQPSGLVSPSGSFCLRGGRDNQQGRRVVVNVAGHPRIMTWNGAEYK